MLCFLSVDPRQNISGKRGFYFIEENSNGKTDQNVYQALKPDAVDKGEIAVKKSVYPIIEDFLREINVKRGFSQQFNRFAGKMALFH